MGKGDVVEGRRARLHCLARIDHDACQINMDYKMQYVHVYI